MNIQKGQSFQIIIIGGGMVGLSLAYQLSKRSISNNICILEREKDLGLHSSGRNSGVLHAGLYYKPNSLKAKICVDGARRLKKWITERGLSINNCGKLIIPQISELDSQIDLLKERGIKNGAEVEIWNEQKIHDLFPYVRTASGRALWSPNTCVVNPKEVINKLKDELIDLGVKIIYECKEYKFSPKNKEIILNSKNKLNYYHLFNCSGLYADLVAKEFNIGKEFHIVPFKGSYWELKTNEKLKINTNIYPVPDLKMPFLGVHFTPSSDQSKIYIGPSASPAFGRENYNNLKGIDLSVTLSMISFLTRQYISNKKGFRKYLYEEMRNMIPSLRIKNSQMLIPSIKLEDIILSSKVGIRPQLVDISSKKLVDDFLCMKGQNSTHILNAISPAFTASFSLADLIIEESGLVSSST
tara:strand:- start:2858 stop:4096 length:1239 start_codon:yes stop_codon:yes gene_type:complete